MEKIQQPNSKKYRRIGKKVGTMVVIMQMVSVFFAVAICITMFRSLATHMLETQCTNGTSMLAYTLSQTSEDADINQLLDDLKSRMGCEFTIFEGDTRAYTTVIQNGQRAVGTKLSSDLSSIILQQGKPYIGTATILNEKYLCSYIPTRDADGKINGLLFAGISSAQATRQIFMTILLSALVSIGVILVGIIIITPYLKKTLSAPLAQITQIAGQLGKGDLGLSDGREITISVQSNDEIGDLAQIFCETIHRLRSYIGEISSILDSIAGGDLTNSVQQEYVGDFASIMRSLNGIEAKLNNTMSQIKMSADQVASSSDQVSGSAQSLAQGATEQASSVAQLSETVNNIAQNARKTSQATREAGQYVDRAGAQLNISMEYVSQLNTAMGKISNSSEQISKIIATIENIAFQTNILALNAAVEAARAGSSGKGFAVVADEVRSLAVQSDQAAKATKKLIEDSVQSVKLGNGLVDGVSQSLQSTMNLASEAFQEINAIADVVQAEVETITHVTDGISQISSVVQTNSATSEESAAVSEELFAHAQVLKQQTSGFRLKR